MDELVARLRAALRRGEAAGPGAIVAIGRSQVDLAAYTITRDGEPVRLTPTEWRLLEVLLPRPVGSSRPVGCSPSSGVRDSSTTRTTSGSTWPGCAANWKTTRRGRSTC